MRNLYTSKPFLVLAGLALIVVLGCKAAGVPSMDAPSLGANPAADRPGSADQALLQDVHGLAEVQDARGEWQAVTGQSELKAGQSVRTGPLSSASLVFYDGSLTTLGPNSTLSIDELDARPRGARQIRLTQDAGESQHTVSPNSTQGARYEVNTPTGRGEAKGTQFGVRIAPDQTSLFLVSEGAVAVTAQEVTVVVEAGQVTSVSPQSAPAAPVFRVSGEGVVSQMGETWVVGETSFLTHPNTVIVGDPQIGDVVIVEGRLLSDNERVADWIILKQHTPLNRFTLVGSVESIGDLAWTIAGQSVDVDENTEIAAGLEAGSLVRASGVVLEDGSLYAERISLLAPAGRQAFEMSGVVQSIGDSEWIVSGVTLHVVQESEISAGIQVGSLVKVEGWIQLEDGWYVSSMQLVETQTGRFEFTGAITSMSPWNVAGVGFEVRDWTEIDAGLAISDIVRVEGTIDASGVWIANEIKRVDATSGARLVFIGTLVSRDPWVVNGIPLVVDADTVIDGDIVVGGLVRVEVLLLEDGTWKILRISPLPGLAWYPSCMMLNGTVVSLEGDQLLLEGWPALTLAPDVTIEGDLAPDSIITFYACFNEDQELVVTSIIVVYSFEEEIIITPGGEDDGGEDQGGKVTICHKPQKKKGGNTITISRSALPAHLAHGDRVGPCK